MGRSKKFDYQTLIESSLIAHPDGLTLDQLLEHSGFNVDRSTLFRHLARLIERGSAERIGKARASRYRLLDPARIAPDPEPPDRQPPAVQQGPEFLQRGPANETPFPPPSEVPQLPQTGRAEPDRVPVAALDGAVVKKVVRTIVREWKRFSRVNLEIYLSLLVEPEHLNVVAEAVEKELAGLHEGNLAGFGLSPAEFFEFTPPASFASTGEQEDFPP